MVSPSVIHPACAVESLSKRFFFRASSSSFFFSFKKSTRRYHVWPRSSSSSSSSTRYIINRIEFSSPFTLLVEAIFGGISRGEIGLPTFSLWLPSLHWRPSTCSSHRSIGFLRKDNDIKKKKNFRSSRFFAFSSIALIEIEFKWEIFFCARKNKFRGQWKFRGVSPRMLMNYRTLNRKTRLFENVFPVTICRSQWICSFLTCRSFGGRPRA